MKIERTTGSSIVSKPECFLPLLILLSFAAADPEASIASKSIDEDGDPTWFADEVHHDGMGSR